MSVSFTKRPSCEGSGLSPSSVRAHRGKVQERRPKEREGKGKALINQGQKERDRDRDREIER